MAETSPPPSTDVVAAPDMSRGAIVFASLSERIRYAEALSHAGLVPVAYQGKPANTLYAVETGTMLGIHPIAAINGINVIQGKPTISPALMSALVRRAGHKCRVRVTGSVTAGDVRATCEVIRYDDPEFTYSATWDIDRAKRAGLWGGRGAWTTYPEAMLKARAISEVCREAAEDALCGIHYVPEELGAEVNVEGEVIEAASGPPRGAQPPQQPPAPQGSATTVDPDALHTAVYGARSRAELVLVLADLGVCDASKGSKGVHRAALEQVQVHDAEGTLLTGWELVRAVGATLPEVTPEGPALATREQLTAVNAAASRFGLTDREARLQWLSEWTEDQRALASSAELTKAEAHRLLDELARRQVEENVRDLYDLDPAPRDAEVVEDTTGEREPDGGAERREETTRPDPARRHPAVAQAMGPVRATAARQAAQAEAARALSTSPDGPFATPSEEQQA